MSILPAINTYNLATNILLTTPSFNYNGALNYYVVVNRGKGKEYMPVLYTYAVLLRDEKVLLSVIMLIVDQQTSFC